MSTLSILATRDLSVRYNKTRALQNVSLDIHEGDFIVIYGQSGSGKSTLLHCISGLEVPTTGSVLFYGNDIFAVSDENDLNDYRKQFLGLIFQQHTALKFLSNQENVALPLILSGIDYEPAVQAAYEMLQRFKLASKATNRPTEVSSGQLQRIMMARALIQNPDVIIADEPTGNLDSKTGDEIIEILRELHKKQRKTVIMATHQLQYRTYATKTVEMHDGTITIHR
ncbi:MAG: ABC transporter ATP-binding protein [Patescibacteria group bacterium]